MGDGVPEADASCSIGSYRVLAGIPHSLFLLVVSSCVTGTVKGYDVAIVRAPFPAWELLGISVGRASVGLTVFQPQQYSKTVRYQVSHQTEYTLSFLTHILLRMIQLLL